MTLLARSTANSSPLLGLVYTAPASKSLMPWTADPPPDVPASLPEFDVGHTYGGQRARGISLFAASSAVDELAVLESKLRTYPKYRRVPGAALAEVAVLLPTFQAPHWTVLFRPPGGTRRPEEELLNDLLDILGPVLDNPRYVPDRSRRR
jgi:hypothetical protein